MKNTKKSKIIGIGSYLPEKILTNKDLEKMVETSDEWIKSRTGIEERRIAKEDEYCSDIGAEAAKKALRDANMSIDEIDCIIVATISPDYLFPSTACLVQKKLKANTVASFDIQAACSGFIYGLSIAKSYVDTGLYKNVLLIAAEKLSSLVNYKDRSTCILFGDGAAACIVSQKQQKGFAIESLVMGSDGEQSDLLILPAGGSRKPASHKTVDENMHFLQMSGGEVFKHAVRRMQQAAAESIEKAGLKESDIDWLIPHQANIRIIEAIAKRFSHLPEERIYKDVVRKFGNTSASSVGISLEQLIHEGKIHVNDRVLLSAFGAGFTWAATVLHYE
jgi:3-oxoacyl-[acyl-carrier-protein] synthase-3